VNEIKMWVGNNGSGSNNPINFGPGLYWRARYDTNKSLIFADGIVWGGIVSRNIQGGASMFRHSLIGGKVLSTGLADDPSKEKYRVYRINKNWQQLSTGYLKDAMKKDFEEWPVEDGAPWVDNDNDGVYTKGVDQPDITGDEILWFVSNDLDISRNKIYASTPIGLEFQTTVFAFDRTNILGRTIFKKYKIINKSHKIVEDMYLGYWSDADLGNPNDDYVGCDTLLNLIYCYNADNNDEKYFGSNPPAIGYILLKGPKVLGLPYDSSYNGFGWIKGFKDLSIKSSYVYAQGYWMDDHYYVAVDYYNLLKGFRRDGHSLIIPITNDTTTFYVPGDPVNKSGWYEGEGWPDGPRPSDRRIMFGTGPFNFAPGDTQEVVIATIVAQGSDNIDAITELKADAARIQYFYNGITLLTDVEKENVVKGFSLSQNYPNPFNPATKIKISIPSVRANCSSPLQIRIYDMLGNEVVALNKEITNPGEYEIEFDAGKYNLSSGVYFYQLRSGNFVASKKMCLIK